MRRKNLLFNHDLPSNLKDIYKKINWYVGSLPTDTQTILQVTDKVTYYPEPIKKYQCEIALPTNSALRETFLGEPCETRTRAKHWAAVNCYFTLEREKMAQKATTGNNKLEYLSEIKVRLPQSQKIYPEKYPAEFETLNKVITKNNAKKTKETGRPGSSKRKQVYKRKVPILFRKQFSYQEENIENNKYPEFSSKVETTIGYLYMFDQTIKTPMAERVHEGRKNTVFYPEKEPLSIGLLTASALPDIPRFPIFTRSGEEQVKLKFIRKVVLLKDHVELLIKFHRYIVKEVLRLERSPLKFSGITQLESNAVIVGLNHFICELKDRKDFDRNFYLDEPNDSALENKVQLISEYDKTDVNASTQRLFPVYPSIEGKISEDHKYIDFDWEFICKIFFASKLIKDWDPDMTKNLNAERKSKKPANVPEQFKFKFDGDRFKDSVLLPTYRAKTNAIDQIDRYYVAKIDTTLNASSPFPGKDDKYQTYIDYFEKKYLETTTDKMQPLLEVDHTPNRLNLIVPRRGKKNVLNQMSNYQTKNEKTSNKHRGHDSTQRFIGELCRIHAVPNFYWKKLVNIPSMMYRVKSLLNANHIRITIAQKAKIGLALSVPLEQLMRPIKLDRYEKRKLTVPTNMTSEQVQAIKMAPMDLMLDDIPEADDENDYILSEPEDEDEIAFVLEANKISNDTQNVSDEKEVIEEPVRGIKQLVRIVFWGRNVSCSFILREYTILKNI